jgi:wyosine [tRNA(Phe)-imidazoG37] synthetase (radical SAM superfamily)
LGVDLVPYKTCTYDCIYCQLDRTTDKTTERGQWLSPDEIVTQIREKLDLAPDYITLAGSGEPTLYASIGELIAGIKEITAIPVAVMTNGSLLWKPDIRRSLAQADLVMPSLCAGTEYLFKYVNRAHPNITFDKMVEGLIQFRQEFKGQYWLEVFVLSGVTTVEAQVENLARCIARINPDRVQVNTVVRPPVESYATPVPQERLEQIARQLHETAEVIAEYAPALQVVPGPGAHRQDILALLERRPCSLADLACGLSLYPHEVTKYVEELRDEGAVKETSRDGHVYYTAPM